MAGSGTIRLRGAPPSETIRIGQVSQAEAKRAVALKSIHALVRTAIEQADMGRASKASTTLRTVLMQLEELEKISEPTQENRT